ncbi:MAG: beta-propeller domain-containing protein [Myxococcales bacterium]|nr:beta-propeller domain-containing protein [Myxococcales bacterium]
MIQRSLRLTMAASALLSLTSTVGCGKSSCDLMLASADPTAGQAPAERNAGSPTPSAAAARVLEEADIIQTDGDRLYTMSKASGLAVVGIASADKPTLLGKHPLAGRPFEMYRRGDVVLAMSNDVFDRNGAERTAAQVDRATPSPPPSELPRSTPVTGSAQIVALDAKYPGSIRKIASFEIPGEIADTRAVGDVLYVVSYEGDACHGCASEPRTVITSFDVSDPAKAKQIDQVAFNADRTATSWKRSVAASAQRLYVAGLEIVRNADGTQTQSAIDVLDVSDPAGRIGVGAKLRIKGEILSRWQMDEHDGVLRVVSQQDISRTRNGTGAPYVDTFTITDSRTISPLGETTLNTHIQEALKSVRFDGPRAYAITFQNTDPLFTIDLSDPAAPKQAGELKIPGFVHHIEPRGDRLVGLGVEQTANFGQLQVSLFDVSDMASPKMLDRVAFGAYNGLQDLTEDQDRIHKAFRVFDDHGLIAVPHTARYADGYGTSSCAPSDGAVQLIKLDRDALSKQALLTTPGAPRRALVHRDHLFTVSETNIRAFTLDVQDGDKPVGDLTIGECQLTTPQWGDDREFEGRGRMGNDVWRGGTCE